MPLKTDYKNFIPSTTTKIFDIKQASDETVINADVKFEDVTVYSQEGDSFGAADINETNTQVNANTDAIALKAPLASPTFTGTPTINDYNFKPLKNAIINGGFQVNQRAVTGSVVLSAGVYGHDRWKAGASGCSYTFATVENVTTLTISAGSLIQVVEGLNLETDTYCLSWEGTAQGKIGAGSYGNSGITGSAVGGTNLNIEFGTGTLSKVRLNKGFVPIEYQAMPYADVLRECQRRFLKVVDETNSGFAMVAFDTTAVHGSLRFPVPFATAPTLSNIKLRSNATGTILTVTSFLIQRDIYGINVIYSLTFSSGSLVAGVWNNLTFEASAEL